MAHALAFLHSLLSLKQTLPEKHKQTVQLSDGYGRDLSVYGKDQFALSSL